MRLREFSGFWLSRVHRAWLLRLQQQELAARGKEASVRVNGLALTLDLSEFHDFIVYYWVTRKTGYESGTTRLLMDALKPGDSFIDVGANNGYYTLLASSLVGGAGRVWAFEPNPSSFGRLQRNITKNALSNVSAEMIGLWDSPGRGHLRVSLTDDGLSSLVTGDGKQVEVPLKRLDDVYSGNGRVIVKIDVEGSELHVLLGMNRILNQSESVSLVVEWNSSFGDFGLVSFLKSHFYVYRVIDTRKSYRLVRVFDDSALPGLCNLWCVRPRASK